MYSYYFHRKDPKDLMNDNSVSLKEENMIRAVEDNMQTKTDSDTEEIKHKPVGPRVKLGPDGKLIIDEQSLVRLIAYYIL